jgi:hypothetical protein
MSVFSKIKFAKKAAKEHKVASAQKDSQGNGAVMVPYKHVPTHAAVDALSGAPSSWKHEDRPKIKEHHKRRSQMNISRTTSSLSTFSYGTGVGVGSSSQAPMPRNSSYSSYNPTWFDRGDQSYLNEPIQKRHKATRGHSYHDSGIGPSIGSSPLVSNMNSNVNSEEVSPVISSGNSTSSNSSSQNLEMPTKPNRLSQRLQTKDYPEKDIFQRLHTSTTRKVGEAPLYDSPPAPVVIKSPMTTANVVAQEQKQKRQRWSLRAKRNTATIAV